MSVRNRQIGSASSTTDTLLQAILKKLDQISKQLGPSSTITTTTTL